ncbi:MAG: AmmeMemoRadiSam system radical SAM enzyme [Anaerolineae bacterium]|nr:AmmeMemoRadiSam system radical SAM enzyme [Anaerolineae bacterium]
MSLQDRLDRMTIEGDLYEVVDATTHKIRCFACGHRCLIKEGGRGICKVRYNEGGKLRVPFGYVGTIQVDPIEKKPFNHVEPGATALSFGMLGCDFHCSYCQNWEISQHGRDQDAGRDPTPITPKEILRLAHRYNARAVASTYNEPLITTEWAVAVFKEAKQAGLRTLYISNGNATPEALQYLRPYLDAYKIDLKTMQDSQYRKLGGVLQHVLDTIRMAYEAGLQVEVVTLVIPGFNDSPEELWQAARYIASVSPDIPWHVTAFHPDYKMLDTPPTSVKILSQAAEIGQEAGLHYVYAGNLPGKVGDFEHTFCPNCHEVVVKRHGFRLIENRLKSTGGVCPRCGTRIAGMWG